MDIGFYIWLVSTAVVTACAWVGISYWAKKKDAEVEKPSRQGTR